jgi:uncharacterized SAM-binding protein YcdF (DUF218 family)
MGSVWLFMFAAVKFLRVADKHLPQKADAVVILAGSPNEDRIRVLEGIAHFHQGRVRYIILPSRHPTFKWSWAVRHYQIDSFIPASKVIIGTYNQNDRQLRPRYGGTYVEALKTAQIMTKYNMRTAIVISSGYHMRRVKMAFENAPKNFNHKYYYQPVKVFDTAGRPWWTIKEYRHRVLREYKKLLAAYFIY